MVFAVFADSPREVFRFGTLDITYGPFSFASSFDLYLGIQIPPMDINMLRIGVAYSNELLFY
jgi:hypothetical protein